MPPSTKCTARFANASGKWNVLLNFPASSSARFIRRQRADPALCLVDVPMDVFSAELPDGSFNQFMPRSIKRPTLDEAAAEEIANALLHAERPVIHVGGGVIRDKGTTELIELAEHLDIPVTHTLMGKGAIPDHHPLRAGMTGFWGTPLVHDLTLNADLVLAVGTRLAEADSSSWDQKSTFKIGPTRLIHIDIDGAELGRNYPTEIGAVSDTKAALSRIAAAAKRLQPEAIQRPGLREKISSGICEFMQQFEQNRVSQQFPLRPERILADVRAAVPEDGLIVTDVGWNKNGVGQQMEINVTRHLYHARRIGDNGFRSGCGTGRKSGGTGKASIGTHRRRRVQQQYVGCCNGGRSRIFPWSGW